MHTPVLLQEVTQALSPAPGKRYVDATLGYAGHTIALLAAGAEVVGIDQDADILELATKRIQEAGYSKHFTPMHASFADALCSARLPDASYQGILFDLGVSSFQLDTPSRGFSFRFDAPLDMRMDQRQTTTAAQLVNEASEEELADIFFYYGEERQARRIAEEIVERLTQKKEQKEKRCAEAREAVAKASIAAKIEGLSRELSELSGKTVILSWRGLVPEIHGNTSAC